jgi:hypothetical protein
MKKRRAMKKFPVGMEPVCPNAVKGAEAQPEPPMTDDHYRRADDGRVLSTAVAAVILILAGLGVMAWDGGRDQGDTAVSILRQR